MWLLYIVVAVVAYIVDHYCLMFDRVVWFILL